MGLVFISFCCNPVEVAVESLLVLVVFHWMVDLSDSIELTGDATPNKGEGERNIG